MFHFFTFKGGLCADPGTQSPVTITASEVDSVQLDCKYTDKNMDFMHCYQQNPTQPLRWNITTTLVVKERKVSGRYVAAADKSQQSGYLSISALSVEDGAVYYCAVRHSVRLQLKPRTKTSASIYSSTKLPFWFRVQEGIRSIYQTLWPCSNQQRSSFGNPETKFYAAI